MGPYSTQELAFADRTGADLWHASAIKQNGVRLRVDAEGLTERLARAPQEHSSIDAPIILALPRPDGVFERFALTETNTMEPGLAARFPTIRTFRGQSLDQPANTLAADFGPNGFHFFAIGPGTAWRIDPVGGGEYHAGSTAGHPSGCCCPGCQAAGVLAPSDPAASPPLGGYSLFSTGSTLRIFRLAVAATGEYYNFSGAALANTQANIVTVVNAANLILERDFCSRLVLVANNADVIFTDPNTDPYSGADVFAMMNENQAVLDSKVGVANYDIGHVFSADAFGGGGGFANAIGAPWKAGGATKAPTWSTPAGQPFIENVVHELGHQFGALHTMNGINGAAAFARVAWTAVEVGSGSSIMAYPGLSGADDLQAVADQFFHSVSYDQVQHFLDSIPAVGTTLATGNTPPAVSAGPDAVIPANTPFILTASAGDADGDSLTYSWEQRDIGPAQALGSADNGQSPLFRAFAPTPNPARTFPNLASVLAGTPSKGEQLPGTDRTLNFRVMVRDNKAGGGGVTLDDLRLTVVNTGAAFQVTSPTAAVSLPAGSHQLVTWTVAGTAAAPINAALVNIRLSTDGGFTWPTLLAASTANDGAEAVLIPNAATSTARIKVEAVGNYFFDVSDVDFTIAAGGPMAVAATTPSGLAGSPLTSLDVTFSQPVNGATVGTDDLALSHGSVTAANLQSPTTVRYTLAGLSGEGRVAITVPAGAVTGTGGDFNLQYMTTLVLDVGSAAFPTSLIPAGPPGTLAYTGATSAAINHAADSDAFTVNLDSGQVVSVTATPAAGLRVAISLTGPGGVNLAASGPASGQAAVIQSAVVAQAGIYTVTVSSPDGSSGDYSLRLDLNAAAEIEANDTTAAAQPLAASAVSLGGSATRWAARGRTDAPAGLLPPEAEPNDTPATAADASRSFTTYSGNLYHLGVRSFAGSYYFKLGDIQANDLLTATMSGASSSRGTFANPALYFYYGPNGFYAGGGDDNGGPGADALIDRFGPDVFDVYYAGAFGAGNFGDSFQLGFLLDNSGAPPLTGGNVTLVTQPNGFLDAADLSTSWRPVQYRSVASGTTSTGDADFYRFQFHAGDLVTFQAHSTSDVDLQLELRNADGVVIAADDGTSSGLTLEDDASIYAYVIPATGDYFVRVRAAGGSGAYALTTLLSATMPPPAAVAPPDYFSLPLAAGQFVTVAVAGQPTGAVTVDIVDAGNVVLAAGGPGPSNYDARLTYSAPSAGTYFLRVSGDPNVEYTLAAASGTALDAEPNNTFAAAQPLEGSRALGAIAALDEDWFQFTANAGEAITLTTATPGDGPGEFSNWLDPQIELYSPSNVLLGADDNSAGDGRNARLTRTAGVSGNYRARVRGVGGTTGEYTLTAVAAIDPPAKVASAVVNGTGQRSRVTDLTITWNEVVTLPPVPAVAFQLERIGPGGPNGNVSLSVDLSGSTPTQTVAKLSWPADPTLTQSASLIDGLYALRIFAAQVTDAAGQALDGDGDGSPGDDFTFNLHRLFGDNDGDRDVDAADFGAFRQAFGSAANLAFDSDGDADVDAADFGQFRLRFGSSI